MIVGSAPASSRESPRAARDIPSASAGLIISPEEYAEVVVGVLHLAAESGDGGVLPGQVASDRQGRAIFGLRLRWPARLRQQGAEVRVDLGQLAAESGEDGVVLG